MQKLNRMENRVVTVDIMRGGAVGTRRVTGRPLTRSRKRIAERDGYLCQDCGRVVAVFEIDHIIPLSAGGSDTDSNKQLLCRTCHLTKSAEDNKQQGVY